MLRPMCAAPSCNLLVKQDTDFPHPLNPHISPGEPETMRDGVFKQSVSLAKRMCVQLHSVLSGFWNNLAVHLGRSPFHRAPRSPLRSMVQGCPSLGNPFGGVKVHWTFTFAASPIATAMALRAIAQPALPACPKIPDPGEIYGLTVCFGDKKSRVSPGLPTTGVAHP